MDLRVTILRLITVVLTFCAIPLVLINPFGAYILQGMGLFTLWVATILTDLERKL